MTSKVVVFGAEFRNKGAEAMARTVLDQFENHEIVIASYKDLDQNLEADLDESVEIVHNVHSIRSFGKAVLSLLGRPHGGFRANLSKIRRLRTIFRHVREADVVLDLSGYALTSKFSTMRMVSWGEGLVLTRLTRTPFVMFPQSVGPFEDRSGRLLLRVLLPWCTRQYVRGSVSESYLREIGVKDVTVRPDTAFLFEPRETEEAKATLESIEGPFVTVVPNARLYERWNDYAAELATITEHVVKESDKEVMFLPHEYTEAGIIDDRDVIQEVLDLYGGPSDRVHTATEEQPAEGLKAIVGKSDLLIGSRLHSTVASSSLAVPTIALGWSRKYYEILEFFNLENYVWIPENYDREVVVEQVDEILSGESANEESLENHLEDVKAAAREPFEYIRTSFLNDK